MKELTDKQEIKLLIFINVCLGSLGSLTITHPCEGVVMKRPKHLKDPLSSIPLAQRDMILAIQDIFSNSGIQNAPTEIVFGNDDGTDEARIVIPKPGQKGDGKLRPPKKRKP